MTKEIMKEFRKKYGLSQQDVADLSEISVAIIRNLESNKAVSQGVLDQLGEFVRDYARFMADVTNTRQAIYYFQWLAFPWSEMPLLNKWEPVFFYRRWLKHEKDNTDRRYAIIWMYEDGQRQRLLVGNLELANLLARHIHEKEGAARTLVVSLDKTEDFYSELGDDFRWGNFKAFGTHPEFYDSKTALDKM